MYSSVYFVIVLIKKLSLIFKKIVVLYIRHKQYEKRNGKGYEYHDLPNCNGNERHNSTKCKKHRHDKMYQPFVLKKSDMFFDNQGALQSRSLYPQDSLQQNCGNA